MRRRDRTRGAAGRDCGRPQNAGAQGPGEGREPDHVEGAIRSDDGCRRLPGKGVEGIGIVAEETRRSREPGDHVGAEGLDQGGQIALLELAQLGADAALKLDCGVGLGAATHITGAFAFAMVGRALELLLSISEKSF